MKGLFKRVLVFSFANLFAMCTLYTPALAQSYSQSQLDYRALVQQEVEEPDVVTMSEDIVIARPLGIMATAAGAGLFLISLPFSILGGNVKQTAHTLVGKPAKETFVRPVGCASDACKMATIG